MPAVHVVRNSVVIGSRLHAVIVVVGLRMMRLEPHTHMHGIELGWKAAIGRVDVVAESLVIWITSSGETGIASWSTCC